MVMMLSFKFLSETHFTLETGPNAKSWHLWLARWYLTGRRRVVSICHHQNDTILLFWMLLLPLFSLRSPLLHYFMYKVSSIHISFVFFFTVSHVQSIRSANLSRFFWPISPLSSWKAELDNGNIIKWISRNPYRQHKWTEPEHKKNSIKINSIK